MESKDLILAELKKEFLLVVKDGEKLLKEKADVIGPVFSAWAEGRMLLLVGESEGCRRLGVCQIDSARRAIEDQYGALKAEAGNLVLDRVLHGLQQVFLKIILPAILKAVLK